KNPAGDAGRDVAAGAADYAALLSLEELPARIRRFPRDLVRHRLHRNDDARCMAGTTKRFILTAISLCVRPAAQAMTESVAKPALNYRSALSRTRSRLRRRSAARRCRRTAPAAS